MLIINFLDFYDVKGYNEKTLYEMYYHQKDIELRIIIIFQTIINKS